MNNYHGYMSDQDLPPRAQGDLIVDEPEDADRELEEGETDDEI